MVSAAAVQAPEGNASAFVLARRNSWARHNSWFVGILLGIAVVCLGQLVQNAGFWAQFPADLPGPGQDLPVFIAAVQMAEAGNLSAAYTPQHFHAFIGEEYKNLYWLNPPHAVLFFAPLDMGHYGVSKAIWIALNTSLLMLISWHAVTRVKDDYGAHGAIAGFALAFSIALAPGAFTNFLLLQLGAAIAACLYFGLTFARTRPILSGLLFAVATIKPQYGLMVPVFLLAIGAWRSIAVACMGTIALIIVSGFTYGFDSWFEFFTSVTGGHSAYATETYEGVITVRQTLAKLGLGSGIQLIGQVVALGASAVAVWFAARRLPADTAIAITLIFSLLAAPIAWVYDWLLITLGLLLLLARRPVPMGVQILAALLTAIPLFTLMFQNVASFFAAGVGILLASGLAAWLAFIQRPASVV